MDKTDRIAIFIWLALSILSTWYFRLLEAFLFPSLLLCLWVLLSLVTNSLILKFTEKRIKLPKSLKYLNRKSPIYELVKEKYDIYYSIYKHELGYFDLKEEFVFFLPFSAIFQTWRYNHTRTIRPPKLDDEGLLKIESLETLFEEIYWKEKAKWDLEEVVKLQKTSMKEQLNKEFKQNYI